MAEPMARDLALGRFREYLHLLARTELDPQLRAELDPSDLVQETLLRAQRAQASFRGDTDRQLAAWLRAILTNTLRDVVHDLRVRTKIIGIRAENGIEESSFRLEEWLIESDQSPGAVVARDEQLLRMADALARLPERQRRALELKHLLGLSVEGVAEQLGVSKGAVVGLLYRGLMKLRELMQEEHKSANN
jgi:RNA polymerase sigma-70 factor (ECF subfamily)